MNELYLTLKNSIDDSTKELPKKTQIRLTTQNHETIYLLILSYCKDEKLKIEKYPFNSTYDQEKMILTFNFNSLPLKLKKILLKYINQKTE